jgi:FlaA1/EpsC-like NDP-sugar epimerase
VPIGALLGRESVPLVEADAIAGGPLTVTHPEVTRFFMTIPEAVQLVLVPDYRPAGLGRLRN